MSEKKKEKLKFRIGKKRVVTFHHTSNFCIFVGGVVFHLLIKSKANNDITLQKQSDKEAANQKPTTTCKKKMIKKKSPESNQAVLTTLLCKSKVTLPKVFIDEIPSGKVGRSKVTRQKLEIVGQWLFDQQNFR